MLRHPSGRPVRQARKTGLSLYRIPPHEPLTPGLRRKQHPVEEVGYLWDQLPGPEATLDVFGFMGRRRER